MRVRLGMRSRSALSRSAVGLSRGDLGQGHRRPRVRLALAFLTLAVLLLCGSPARAETWGVPLGGRAVSLGEGRVVCTGAPLESGWSADAEGRMLRPPVPQEAIGKVVSVKTAPTQAACAASSASLSVVAVGPRPSIDSLTVDVDGGRIVAQGRKLRGAVLVWAARGRTGSDVCSTPQVVAGVGAVAGAESCAFSAPRDLPADLSALRLEVLPAGASPAPDAILFDALGARAAEGSFDVRSFEVAVQRLVTPDASVDMSSGAGHVALVHAEAVASVSCVDATCSLEGNDLVVRNERGSDDQLDVHLQLRPHVVLRANGPADQAPLLVMPLQRCPVAIASAAVVSNADDPRVVLRVTGSCARAEGELSVATEEGPGRVERTELIAGALYAVVRVGRVDGDAVVVTVRRRGTILGTARAPAHRLVWRTRLELDGHGAIDFIPTNRWARVKVPSSPHGTAVVVRAVEGVYEAKRDDSGSSFVRGVDGASGSVPLRLALVDESLPSPLLGLTLGEASEPVDRAIRTANVPVELGPAVLEKSPLVELVCGDGAGRVHSVHPGTTSQIPYRARDTCQLVFHRERLQLEDGAQRIHVTVNVTGADGAPRADARLDEKLVLRANPKPRMLAITGATDPFDRLSVRMGNEPDTFEENGGEEDKRRAPETQWSVVTGTSRARLYGTTAIPTGLFRVADAGHSGILTLSVGALMRVVPLSRDGIAFPLGLEAGVMWLGIAGDTDSRAAAGGAVAIVAGTGVAVPIANATHASQTAISLHAWFEYEVSRQVLGQQGQAYGFVFGPSISIGDVGTNF